MTGGDRQKGRFLYRDFVEYMPTAKVHLVGNHRPRIIGRDHGFWRRFRMINWGVMIPNERQNLHLAAELAEEFPGILNWLIEGYRALGCRGTQPPDSVMVASEQFREASDPFGDFLREMTVDAPEATISKAELYTQYTRYCDQQGIQPRYRLTKRAFGNRIAERGYREIRTHGGVHVWQGLRQGPNSILWTLKPCVVSVLIDALGDLKRQLPKTFSPIIFLRGLWGKMLF